jgi:predicted transcriptional regulator
LSGYGSSVTETLTIHLPKSLAREFRAKTRAAKTNPTEVLRRAVEDYVKKDQTARDAAVEHIQRFAGTWDGYISGEELLKRTRPRLVVSSAHRRRRCIFRT